MNEIIKQPGRASGRPRKKNRHAKEQFWITKPRSLKARRLLRLLANELDAVFAGSPAETATERQARLLMDSAGRAQARGLRPTELGYDLFGAAREKMREHRAGIRTERRFQNAALWRNFRDVLSETAKAAGVQFTIVSGQIAEPGTQPGPVRLHERRRNAK
jgi:hypothetical protein